MSVSTVVRHVLLNTFGLVEDIVNDSADVALALTGDGPEPAAPRPRGSGSKPASESGEILAWQEAVLNLNAVCEQCNAVLHKGARAALGIRDGAGSRVIICPSCLEHVQQEPIRLSTGRALR
jgi:hypothetical protein